MARDLTGGRRRRRDPDRLTAGLARFPNSQAPAGSLEEASSTARGQWTSMDMETES